MTNWKSHTILSLFTIAVIRFIGCLLLCVFFLSASNDNYGNPAIEVDMRISLEGKRSGDAQIIVKSSTETHSFDANIKEKNIFYLDLGDVYIVTVKAIGFASKRLVFDARHQKARTGTFPCDIDLVESKDSYEMAPPIVGRIVWSNFKKEWVHE
ncbi:MAG: hypothetical protein P8O05_05610 [Flavobacteriales bacterium]|nr:hypothetical protein [Flavobacteriales bacterium]